MINFHFLFRFALPILFFVGSHAFAAPPIDGWKRSGMSIFVTSAGAACVYQLTIPGQVYTAYGDYPTHCQYAREGSGDLYYASLFRTPNAICPDGSAPNTTKPLAEQCGQPDTCSDKNPFVRKFLFGSGSGGASLPTALGGCAVTVTEVLVCRTETISGITSTYCMLELTRTGQTADNPPGQLPSTSAPDNPVDPKVESPPLTPSGGQCPTGTSQVGSSASGTPICVGGGSAPGAPSTGPTVTTGPVQTTTNPDGSTTATQTVSKTNADGSTTTTTTVTKTAVDGTKTVSQSGSTSLNAAGGEGTSEDPESQNFCKQNPLLNVCKNSNVNGTCGDVTCNGDAIQCATLRATAAMQCAQDKDREDMEASETTQFGKSLVSGNDPMTFEIGEMLKGDEIDMAGGANLDSSGFLPSACIGSKTFTVMGRQVIVHFASVCDSITPLRYVIMAIALIASYMIVGKSILQG